MITKKISMYLVAILAITFANLNNAMADERKEFSSLPNFDEIGLGVYADLTFKQGNDQLVVMEGPAATLEKIEVEVKQGKLKITRKDRAMKRNSKVKIQVTVKSLKGVSMAGAGKMIGEGTFNAKNFTVSLSGAGDIKLNSESQSMTVKIAGSGKVALAGKSKHGEVSIAGSGDLDALGLSVDTYNIRISGSGNCNINVAEEIDSRIAGSGNVNYKGNPSKVNTRAAGSGKVRKI